jgi:hypothetical protein
MSTLLDKTTVIRETGYRYWLAPLKMTTSGVKLQATIPPTQPATPPVRLPQQAVRPYAPYLKLE